EREIKIRTSALDDVHIIAADRAGRLITVIKVPALASEAAFGQKTALNLRGEVQIVFEGLPFPFVQMIDTKTFERIGDKSIRLDGILTNFAYAVGAGLKSFECGVHFLQQCCQLRIRTRRRKSCFDTFPALDQLFAHDKIEVNTQREPP